MDDFNRGLQRHLWKAELEYRAKHLPNGSNVDWMAPNCNSISDVVALIRYLGLRIRRVVDEVDAAGEKHQWVETTRGIIIYVNRDGSRGFMAARPDSRA